MRRSANNQLLQELLTSAHDPARLGKLLDLSARKLSPELAAEAQQVYAQAASAGQMPLAQAASLVATRVYLSLGLRYQSLVCFFDFNQCLFWQAATVEDYQIAQETASKIIVMAEDIQASDLTFQATMLSANCFYFASQIAEDSNTKESLLVNALENLVHASKWRNGANKGEWFQQFVSLLCAVLGKMMWSTLKEKASVQSFLREVAAAIEELVPIEFTSNESLVKTVADASILAYLSCYYGNAVVANARLGIVIDSTERSGVEVTNLLAQIIQNVRRRQVTPLAEIFRQFFEAPIWTGSYHYVKAHPELLSGEADILLEELITVTGMRGETDIVQVLEEYRDLLQRCHKIGLEAAFAEKGGVH